MTKNKIRRERAKFRNAAKASSTSDVVLNCISYNGNKDMTLNKQTSEKNAVLYRVTEEHITIVKEPESIFVGYATPAAGTGIEIQKAMVNFLNSEGFSLDYLEFHVPKSEINFVCNTYTEIIKWDELQITEPACLYFYTDEQLVQYQNSSHEIIKIPGKYI